MTELLSESVSDAAPPGGSVGRQIRVLLGGGFLGAVLLAASLGIDFSGANDVSVPQMPKLPSLPAPSLGLPSGFPTDLPTGLPTGFPTGLPSGFPTSFPTDLPGLPGGGS